MSALNRRHDSAGSGTEGDPGTGLDAGIAEIMNRMGAMVPGAGYGSPPPPPARFGGQAVGSLAPSAAELAAAHPELAAADPAPGAGLDLGLMVELRAALGCLAPTMEMLRGWITSQHSDKRQMYRHVHPGKLPAAQITAAGVIQDQQKFAPRTGFAWHITRLSVQGQTSTTGVSVYRDSAATDSTGSSPTWLNGAPLPAVIQTALNPLVLTASPSTIFNNNPYGVLVNVSGGTVSAIAVNGTSTGATSGTFFVPAGGTITVTYTVAPTLTTSQLPSGGVSLFWEPKTLILLPQDQLLFASAGGGITVNGEMVEIELPWLPAYLL